MPEKRAELPLTDAQVEAAMERLMTDRPDLGVCEHGTDRSTDWCVVCDRDLYPAVELLAKAECKYVCKCGTYHAKEPTYCVHRFEQHGAQQSKVSPPNDDEIEFLLRKADCIDYYDDDSREPEELFEVLHHDFNLLAKAYRAQIKQAYDPMLVVHIDSSTTKTHPVDQPCAFCRPPIIVTAEMVDRAVAAFCDRKLVNSPAMTDSMRSALEAALNYQP